MTPVVPRDVLNLEQTFTEFDKLTRQDIAGNHEVIPQIIDYGWYVTIDTDLVEFMWRVLHIILSFPEQSG